MSEEERAEQLALELRAAGARMGKPEGPQQAPRGHFQLRCYRQTAGLWMGHRAHVHGALSVSTTCC